MLRRLLAVLPTVAFAAGLFAEIPPSFRSANSSRTTPLWVSAREAVAADGRLRASALESREINMVTSATRAASSDRARSRESNSSSTSDTCDVRFGPPIDDAPGMDRLASLDEVRDFARSHDVIQGHVAATEVGFYEGVPFTIVELSGAFRGPRFLLLPGGTVTVEGARVCTGDASMGLLPRAGDDVLAIVATPIDDHGVVYRLPGERVFVQRGGALHSSPILAHDLAHSRINTLSQLRLALRLPPLGKVTKQHGDAK